MVFDIRWSDELDDKFISDFITTKCSILSPNYNRQIFDRQFLNNIYGKSVIAVVYDNDKPVAVRAAWRNDIAGREAYQNVMACVMPEYRNKGVFTDMTKKVMSFLPIDAVIYSFPNQNSYARYEKLGWNISKRYIHLFLSYDAYKKEYPVMLDEKYANWWLLDKNLYYTCINKHYFLLKKNVRPMCFEIFAETEECVAKRFNKAQTGLLFYSSAKPTFFSKLFLPGHIVCNQPDINIPKWKIDAV